MCSLENMEGENEVRDFVVYAFSPIHERYALIEEIHLNRIKSLNPQQRLTLRSLMTEFAKCGTD